MPRKDFAAMFPHADADAIELLNRMLQFDPKKRVTPKEALESSFFDGMRRPDLEATFSGSLVLPYDFTNMNSDESMQTCRTLIYNEVLQFMKEREEEEEKISFVRRLSSSSKVYKQLITKQQPSSVLDEDKKKCAIL